MPIDGPSSHSAVPAIVPSGDNGERGHGRRRRKTSEGGRRRSAEGAEGDGHKHRRRRSSASPKDDAFHGVGPTASPVSSAGDSKLHNPNTPSIFSGVGPTGKPIMPVRASPLEPLHRPVVGAASGEVVVPMEAGAASAEVAAPAEIGAPSCEVVAAPTETGVERGAAAAEAICRRRSSRSQARSQQPVAVGRHKECLSQRKHRW